MSYATESNRRQPAAAPFSAEAFQAQTGAPDAAVQKLRTYLATLERWQPKINLVGTKTLADPWRRHFLDSAQLLALVPPDARHLVDIGSGAGFPGLVLAVLAAGGRRPELQVTVIESDQRKCIFLNEIKRLMNIPVTVHQGRAEAYAGRPADVATARACAPLTRLLPWVSAVSTVPARALLLKGEGAGDELTAAEKDWKMRVHQHPSVTDPRGVILEVTDLARRPDDD